MTPSEIAEFGQEECNRKYFLPHLGDFQSFRLHDYLYNYFTRLGYDLPAYKKFHDKVL